MGRDTVSSEGFSLKQLHHDSEPLHPLPFPSFTLVPPILTLLQTAFQNGPALPILGVKIRATRWE